MPPTNSPRFRLSLVQLIASALAAVTAAIAGTYLGVNGTVIGAAVASVLSVLGTALYSHSIERTGHRVRTVVPVTARWLPERAGPPVPAAPVRDRESRRLSPLARVGIAAVFVFVAALGVVTGVELLAGRPVSDLVRGTSANGTTVFGSQARTSTTPTPAVTVTVTPNVVVTTPTITQTAPAVTVTSTPTTSVPAPTPTPTVSGTPSDTTVP